MKKEAYFRLVLFQLFLLFSVCVAQECIKRIDYSGQIYKYAYAYSTEKSCWSIAAHEDMYVRLDLTEQGFNVKNCSTSFLQIDVAETGEEYIFCHERKTPKTIISLNDVNITFVHNGGGSAHFTIDYSTGKSVAAVKGVNSSRENAVAWLKRQQLDSFGWGKNTHRAITTLYLAGNTSFRGDNIEEEFFAKKLELQTLVALLRNSSNPLSVSDLSMFINALTVTCYNPRQFYGHDLLQVLSERVAASKIPIPGAYLTLCNSNGTLPESSTRNLMNVLVKQSEYPIHLDIQAMTVMALSCVRNKTKDFNIIQNAIYNTTIEQFVAGQQLDGSFGNVYTTALVTQALLSTRQENNKLWKLGSTVRFFMEKLHSSADLLSAYLTLPILNDKSLVDIGKVNCKNHRKHGEDDEISEVTKKLRGKMRIQYSLYIGNQKDETRTIYMDIAENSSAFDVIKVAQVVDPTYKFLYSDASGYMYVYEIAGVTNDPEAGKFWFLYTENSPINGNARRRTERLDEFIVEDGVHMIMWYKTVHI